MKILCLHAGHLPPILTGSEQNTHQHTRENTKWREQNTVREMELATPEDPRLEPMSYSHYCRIDSLHHQSSLRSLTTGNQCHQCSVCPPQVSHVMRELQGHNNQTNTRVRNISRLKFTHSLKQFCNLEKKCISKVSIFKLVYLSHFSYKMHSFQLKHCIQ